MTVLSPKSYKEVCAVVTTYRPNGSFSKRIEYTRQQVGMVVIIDDGDCMQNKLLLKTWFEKIDNVIYYHNIRNVGIAASLNKGIQIAREQGYEWFLTLDDDSALRSGMVDFLIMSLRKIKSKKPIGLIGMSWSQKGNIETEVN